MGNCIVCGITFKKTSIRKTCSKKCQLLSCIEKQENGCWLYKKSTSGAYSKFRWERKWFSAHRISYEVFNGKIVDDKWVCHSCDNPKCVNPKHLFLGDASENRRDALSKNRIPIGEKCHFSKFSDTQICEMRLLKKEGFTYERLSRIFNCSIVHIFNVVKNSIRKEKSGV